MRVRGKDTRQTNLGFKNQVQQMLPCSAITEKLRYRQFCQQWAQNKNRQQHEHRETGPDSKRPTRSEAEDMGIRHPRLGYQVTTDGKKQHHTESTRLIAENQRRRASHQWKLMTPYHQRRCQQTQSVKVVSPMLGAMDHLGLVSLSTFELHTQIKPGVPARPPCPRSCPASSPAGGLFLPVGSPAS